MPRPALPRPTHAELAILHILWERGSCTVRQVHEAFGRARATGYTTTLKLMQIMLDKGLVNRDGTRRTHIYQARLPEDQAQRELAGDLLERAFGGSAEKLVLRALQSRQTSPEELDAIRRLLDTFEEELP